MPRRVPDRWTPDLGVVRRQGDNRAQNVIDHQPIVFTGSLPPGVLFIGNEPAGQIPLLQPFEGIADYGIRLVHLRRR